MSNALWSSLWDETLEEYAKTVHYDTKYQIEKRVIIFWYCFSRFLGWTDCFNQCDEDVITREWKEKIDKANKKEPLNINHWLMTVRNVLRNCKDKITPQGHLKEFVGNVFKRETKNVCEPLFLYLFYLSLYTEKPNDSASQVAGMKKIRRDTFESITQFKRLHPDIDTRSLFCICKEVYALK